MNLQRMSVIGSSLVGMGAVVLGCAIGIGGMSTAGSPKQPIQPDTKGNVIGPLNPCGYDVGAALGVIGRLMPDTSAEAIPQVHGWKVEPLLKQATGSTAPGNGSLVLLSPNVEMETAASLASDLSKTAGIAETGVVSPRSDDPALKSCFVDLSDDPADAPLQMLARDAMVSGGYVSEEAANSASSAWLVSDDPLDRDDVIVTMAFTGPVNTKPALGSPSEVHGLSAAAAIIDRTTNKVIAVGLVDWYA